MKLTEFVERNVDAIVDERAEFAQANLRPARDLPAGDLRDHAKHLLLRIADDMDTPQKAQDQHEKSRGGRPGNSPDVTSTARADAEQRLRNGFSLNDLVAEYRALRASVVRRWTDQVPSEPGALKELVRFNEAMDQATSEAIALYNQRVEQSRSLLLGVLGHDVRTPLGVVRNSSEYLRRGAGLTDAQMEAVVRIRSSTDRMRRMVDDLLDFTRIHLGGQMPIAPGPANLGQLCRQTLDELQALYPDRTLHMDCCGELAGQWDVSRIRQLLSNLVVNAIQHGTPDSPVTVSLQGEQDTVLVQVHNQGPVIAAQARRMLFDPLARPMAPEAQRHPGSSGLGLGLYIVREIALAHGGQVQVDSPEQKGTTFIVRLPRTAPTKGSMATVASH